MRIMLVDDHEVVRQGIKSLLQRQQGMEVVAEAGSVSEAVKEAARSTPDVVVMDLRLPDGSGVDACREIRAANASIRVLMLTSFPDEEAVFDAIVAGASGYILKQVRARELVSAIQKVGQGESLLDPAVTQKVLQRIKSLAEQPGKTQEGSLSQQEQRILSLISQGKTNREIAAEIFLSEKTVKNYVSSILEKLNLSRRSEAAAYYVRRYGGREER